MEEKIATLYEWLAQAKKTQKEMITNEGDDILQERIDTLEEVIALIKS